MNGFKFIAAACIHPCKMRAQMFFPNFFPCKLPVVSFLGGCRAASLVACVAPEKFRSDVMSSSSAEAVAIGVDG